MGFAFYITTFPLLFSFLEGNGIAFTGIFTVSSEFANSSGMNVNLGVSWPAHFSLSFSFPLINERLNSRKWSVVVIRSAESKFISHFTLLGSAVISLFSFLLYFLFFFGHVVGDSGASSLSEALKVNSSLTQLSLYGS